MACSQVKRSPGKRMPAIDLYDGPLWQTLRVHQGRLPSHNVCVLSGRYGFINACTAILPYEGKLSTEAANWLVKRDIDMPNTEFGRIKAPPFGQSALREAGADIRVPMRPYSFVLIAASGDYARVLRYFASEFKRRKLVTADAAIITTSGAIGMQRQQLGHALHRLNGNELRMVG